MDRSLFPEGVEVRQADLERTEDTKAFHILQRQLDIVDTGVASGFEVTVNTGSNLLVDVAAGTGYAPNGEYVEFTSSQVAIPLSDYTASVINFVLAVYSEVDGDLQPHETNGESLPTSATRDVRITVLTQAEYEALPETDENLNNDARDRALIIAKVVAQGAGLSIANYIINATDFGSAAEATNTTGNITGVAISSVDRDTQSGTGTLTYTQTTPPTSLTWKAPGESSSGVPVDISTNGTYILTSVSGLTLTVVVTSNPGSDQTDTISVDNIYGQVVPRLNAQDLEHRGKLGTGIVSDINPHGLRAEDLGVVELLETHQDLFHSNGLHRDSWQGTLECNVNATNKEQMDITDFSTTAAVDRLYINGEIYTALDSTTVDFSSTPGDFHAIWDLYAVDSGSSGTVSIETHERMRYALSAAASTLANYVQLRDVNRDLVTSGTPRILYNDSNKTLEFDSGSGTFGTAIPVPLNNGGVVMTLPSNFDLNFLDVYVDTDNISGIGTIPENLTLYNLPSVQDEKYLIATTLYGGGTTNPFLGNGFGAGNAPNDVKNQRLYGNLGFDDLRDDAGIWEKAPFVSQSEDDTNPDQYPNQYLTLRDAAFTRSFLGIGIRFADPIARVYVDAGNDLNVGGIIAKSGGTSGGKSSFGVKGICSTFGFGVIGEGGSSGSGVKGVHGGATGFGTGGVVGINTFNGGTVGPAIYAEDSNTSADRAALHSVYTGGNAGSYAIRGTCQTSGIGVYGDGNGGPGVRGKSSSSFGVDCVGGSRAPLRLTPQVTPAIDQGGAYVDSTTGKLRTCNGTEWERQVAQVYGATTGSNSVTGTAETTLNRFYNIPGGTLNQGTTIRIWCYFDTDGTITSSTQDLTLRLYYGDNTNIGASTLIATSNFTNIQTILSGDPNDVLWETHAVMRTTSSILVTGKATIFFPGGVTIAGRNINTTTTVTTGTDKDLFFTADWSQSGDSISIVSLDIDIQ